MTDGLGPSWLTGTPDGAVITRREVHLCAVTAVWPGEHFTARVPYQRSRKCFAWVLIADDDVPLVRAGAKFWLVVERVRLRGYGRPEVRSAIAFRRPGALSPERAFTNRRENTHA